MKKYFSLLFSLLAFASCVMAQQKKTRNMGVESTIPLSTAKGIAAIADSSGKNVGRLVDPIEFATKSELNQKAYTADLSNLNLQLRSDLAAKTALIDSLKNVVVAWHSAAFTPGTPINTSLFGFDSWRDGWHGISFFNNQYGTSYNINTQSTSIELSSLQYNSATNTYVSTSPTTYISDNDILMVQIKNGAVYAWYRMAANSRLAYEVTNMSSTLNSYISSDTIFRASGSFVKIGQTAMSSRSGASNAIAIGMGVMSMTPMPLNNIGIGTNALMGTTGQSNTVVGINGLTSGTTASGNTVIGYKAAQSMQTGTDNVAVGQWSLRAASTGVQNTGLGSYSLYSLTNGQNNIAIGNQAGYTLTTGSSNILIGQNIDVPTATTSNYLNIGGWITGNNGAINITNSLLVANSKVVAENRFLTESIVGIDGAQTFDCQSAVLKTFVISSISGGQIIVNFANIPQNGIIKIRLPVVTNGDIVSFFGGKLKNADGTTRSSLTLTSPTTISCHSENGILYLD